MLRTLMLRLASNQSLLQAVYRLGSRYRLARRFVAGETMDEAVSVVRDLNRRGMAAALDLLGESVFDEEEACRAADSYVELLDCIAVNRLDAYVSVKLTHLGLDVSGQTCATNLARIVDKAKTVGNFVRIDMEGSRYTQSTLDLFEQLWPRYPDCLGIVIQAYLHRSWDDVRRLSDEGCRIRLCKGAYMEPPDVAFPRKRDVDSNYLRLMEFLLLSPAHTAIATHDSRMIDSATRFVAQRGISDGRYEFQMLYGVRRAFQLALVEQGYRMRVYVPFGRNWAPYFMRRLAERPANVLFVLRNLVRD